MNKVKVNLWLTATPLSSYRSDEACSRLHCAQASVSYFQRQDLSTWGHAVSLGLFWEVPCRYTGDVSPMCTCRTKENSLVKMYIEDQSCVQNQSSSPQYEQSGTHQCPRRP